VTERLDAAMSKEPPTTRIARSSAEDVFIRGKSLCGEIIGKMSFTQLVYFHVTGSEPTPAQVAVLDAGLVTLVEHGMTPSAVAARLTYTSAPEAMQAGVAAGLLGVGSLFVGTVEGCAALLERIVGAEAGMDQEAEAVAREHRDGKRRLPGFGHPEHRPDDPRTPCLFRVAEDQGVAGAHVDALRALGRAVDAVYGKHITINATGAFAAVLADAGLPVPILRGFALIARCAGLVGHIHEEQNDPTLDALWHAAAAAVPYDGD